MNLPSGRIQSTTSTTGRTGTPATSGRFVGGGNARPLNAPLVLQEGQIVKGEVVDLRNNEVTLALSDGTTIKAGIADHSNLSIGQTASFKVVEMSSQSIVLKYLPTKNMGMQDLAILKALEEAQIPKTERNTSIVRELLNQRMPVHKDSIQQMIRHSLSNPEVSTQSLVLMKKHHLPITPANAQQFEQFRDGGHSLIGKIEQLSESLPDLLDALAKNAPERDVAAFGNRFIALLADPLPEPKSLNLDLTFLPSRDRQALAEQLKELLPPEHPLLNAKGELIIQAPLLDGSMPLSDIRQLLSSVLTKMGISMDDLVSQTTHPLTTASQTREFSTTDHAAKDVVLETASQAEPTARDAATQSAQSDVQKDASPKDAASQSAQNEAQKGAATQSVQNEAQKDAAPQSAQAEAQKDAAPPTTQTQVPEHAPAKALAGDGESAAAQATPTNERVSHLPQALRETIGQIEEQWRAMRQANQEIGSLLTPGERRELLQALEPAHLPREAVERIASGRATLPETISTVQKLLSSPNPSGAAKLLSGEPFQNLLKEVIQTNWMLSPAQLMHKEKVDVFYPKLFHELNEVTQLIQNNLGGQDCDFLAGQNKSLQQNIDFMKSLNHLFSYIQLPVHAKDKNIHSDLYVYTKKQDMQKRPNKLRALLHLDMEHLGALDVDITLENRSVHSTFYCTDSFGQSLLETNIHLLEDSLAENGYSFHASVVQSKKEFDVVKDILEADAPKVGMTRYSFDIRA